MQDLHPTNATVPDDDNLLIEWSDGTSLVYPMDLLRASCPCASCVDEWTGEVKVNRAMFPNITLKTLDHVGNYALQIGFSDGHSTGIFTYELLTKIGQPPATAGEENPFQV